jgi:hypothetical protein
MNPRSSMSFGIWSYLLASKTSKRTLLSEINAEIGLIGPSDIAFLTQIVPIEAKIDAKIPIMKSLSLNS